MEFKGLNIEDMPDRKRILFQSAVTQLGVDPFGLHGVLHWNAVFQNCLMLNPVATIVDEWFYWCFSCLHDCCREDEYVDPEHGQRAADIIEDTVTRFGNELHSAILDHSIGDVASTPLVNVCWDADRLELVRVNITPDPAFMCTEAGKEAARAYNPSLIVKPGHQGKGGIYLP